MVVAFKKGGFDGAVGRFCMGFWCERQCWIWFIWRSASGNVFSGGCVGLSPHECTDLEDFWRNYSA